MSASAPAATKHGMRVDFHDITLEVEVKGKQLQEGQDQESSE